MPTTVVLVEDSELISENLTESLQELAATKVLKVAQSEREAREWLASNADWQLAVVDLFLNQGSGLGVVQSLQQRSTAQRVVVLSNYATLEMRRQCVALGADLVFDKSTELDAFFDYCRDFPEA